MNNVLGINNKIIAKTIAVKEKMNIQTAMRSIFVSYYRDTLGLPDWEQVVEKRFHFRLDVQIRRIAAFVELTDKRVLDVGCGFGDLMLGLKEAGAREIVGIDPDTDWVGIAAKRGRAYDEYMVSQAVGEYLPLADNSFDIVCSNMVVEHVNDLPLVVSEMIRVLKPGGTCIINFPNYLFPWEPHYRIPWFPYTPKPIGKRLLEMIGRDPYYFEHHIHYVTAFKLLSLLKQNNITDTINLMHKSTAHPDLFVNQAIRVWLNRFSQLPLSSTLMYLFLPASMILAKKSS